MTKRRRKGHGRPGTGTHRATASQGGSADRAAPTTRSGTRSPAVGPASRGRARAAPPARRTRGARGGRRGIDAPHPPVLVTLARGLSVVGSSPPFVVSVFLAVLALWLVYSSTGVIQIAKPGVMAQVLAVPPLQSALDANFFYVGIRAFSLSSNIAISLGLLLLRAASVGFWVSLALERFEHGTPGWEAARAAAHRARGSFRALVGVQAAFMVIMVALSILSPFLGQLLLPLLFIAPLYFLAFTPVVAVRERTGVRRAFALSFAAARLRGSQHSILVLAYGFVTLMLLVSTSGGVATPATPTVLVWMYVLILNFVHLGVLATFTYRWLLVHEVVIASGAGESRNRSRPTKPTPATLR